MSTLFFCVPDVTGITDAATSLPFANYTMQLLSVLIQYMCLEILNLPDVIHDWMMLIFVLCTTLYSINVYFSVTQHFIWSICSM